MSPQFIKNKREPSAPAHQLHCLYARAAKRWPKPWADEVGIPVFFRNTLNSLVRLTAFAKQLPGRERWDCIPTAHLLPAL